MKRVWSVIICEHVAFLLIMMMMMMVTLMIIMTMMGMMVIIYKILPGQFNFFFLNAVGSLTCACLLYMVPSFPPSPLHSKQKIGTRSTPS